MSRHNKTNKMNCAPSEDCSAWASAESDQSLLSAWRNTGPLTTYWAHSEDSDQTGQMPRLIWVFAGRTSFCWRLKCREAAQMSAVHQVLTVILETFWNLTNLRGITLVSLRSSSVNLQPNEPAINENQMICNQMSWNQMRLWYSSNRQSAKAQASLRIRAVSPEPSLSTHMKYGSRWRVRPKIRHLAPLDGCACAFEEWVYGGRKVP